MTTARHRFTGFLMKECSGLNYALLNYIYDDIIEFPSHETLEILIDKDDYKALLYVISSAKEISRLKIIRSADSQRISIYFSDRTSLCLKIKISIEHNGIYLMKAREVLRHAVVNKQNIKIPAPCYQFEYLLLTQILNKKSIDDRYRKYFSKFSFEVRSKIFAHVAPKYHFIINILDDLYVFQKHHYYKIRDEVMALKQNNSIPLLKRKVILLLDTIRMFFARLAEKLFAGDSVSSTEKTFSESLKNLRHRKAIMKHL